MKDQINETEKIGEFKPNHTGLDENRAWIPGYEGYYCADRDGAIWHVPSSKKAWHCYCMKQFKASKNNHGYLTVMLSMSRCKKRCYTVQTLMGMAWLGYDANGLGRASEMVVDHINDDRADNRLCNLSIMTRANNLRKRDWKGQIRRKGKQKPIVAKVIATGETEYYRSGIAASLALHGDNKYAPMICCALQGNIKTAYGRVWRYSDWDEYEKATGDVLAD